MSKKEDSLVPNSSLLHVSTFHFCFGFLRRWSLSDDAEEASRIVLPRPTAATRAGARGLDERVSPMRALHECSEQSQ